MTSLSVRRIGASCLHRSSLVKSLSAAHYSTVDADSSKWEAVPRSEVKRFIIDCMLSVGTRRAHAASLADNLVAADYRGHYSHGLNRLGQFSTRLEYGVQSSQRTSLPMTHLLVVGSGSILVTAWVLVRIFDMYVHDIETGITVSDGDPQVRKEAAATAHVDGMNLLGPVVGNFCMDLAMKKAKQAGVGWVVARGSNHYGIAGWYALQACQNGLLGMSFTNTSPLQVPTRAKQAVLGTNPISLAAPAKNGDSFVLDMATSTCALGKIELHERKQMEIPDGWGVDSQGQMSNDPSPVLNGGGLMPLGGSELTGGYKGYGLAMMVEIFCGILGNADFGPHIRRWKNTEQVANLGQCFIAVDPDSFAPGFTDRMSELIDVCRDLPPVDSETEVLVAGDPEKKHMSKCDTRGGIPYHPKQIQFGKELAKTLDVEAMRAC